MATQFHGQANGELCQPVQVLQACQVMEGISNCQALEIAEAAKIWRQLGESAISQLQLPAFEGAMQHFRAGFARRMERVSKQDDKAWHSS